MQQGEPQERRDHLVAVLLPDMGGGGAERVALEVIRELLEAGHRVDLLLLRASGALLALVPAEVRIIDLGASRLLGAFWPLVRYFRRERPDAIQISMWPLTTIAIFAHRLARSRARIMTSDHIAFDQKKWRYALPVRLTGPLYRLADVRVAVSEGAVQSLAGLTGMRRDQFELILNPISPPDEIRATPEAEYMWGTARDRIIAAGSLKPQKNHALLLRAFARMRRQGARLVILGEGPLRAELEALAAELGIAEDVIMPGFVLDPWPYYASASLFVLSSDYEGFANVVLEALAAGVPVVSTDCPSGPSEILDQGRYGRLVPVGDEAALAAAMAASLDSPGDPAVRQARAASFSSDSARRYVDLLVPPHA